MTTTLEPTSDHDDLKAQLQRATEPHTKSRQAVDGRPMDRHVDGANIYRRLGLAPWHKYLDAADRAGKNVARYPGALVDALAHVSDRELDALRKIASEGVEYDPDDPDVSHPALRETHNTHARRAKLLEWLAADPRRVKALTAGGTDCQLVGSPGSGKTTAALYHAATMLAANEETVVWADTLDESGTNERLEWLAFAPWTTLALPAGYRARVLVHPSDPSLPAFEWDVHHLCRDVVRYDSPEDLLGQLEPGQFTVVYPDPAFRGCRDVSKWAYWPPRALGAPGAPGEPTAPVHWWFAFVGAFVSRDVYGHPTTLVVDEAGNWLDPDARANAHQGYEKVKWLSEKFADARKKGLSVWTLTHALAELHPKFRAKQRWWATMAGNEPPATGTLPGGKSCPIDVPQRCLRLDVGECQVWTTNRWCEQHTPNVKSLARVDAKISINLLPSGGGRNV